MKISKELLEKAKQAKSADGGYVYSLSNGETKGENSLYR